jgi:hypothetical protein
VQSTESPESEDDEIVSGLNENAPSTSTSPTDHSIADAGAGNLPAAMFPCQLKYMDLSVLKLKQDLLRVPLMVQIRDEWKNVSDYLDGRPKGHPGSVIVTGQPGIGK